MKLQTRVRVLCLACFLFLFAPAMSVCAQTQTADAVAGLEQHIWHARVVDATTPTDTTIPGTDTIAQVQQVRAEILEGTLTGTVVSFSNDFVMMQDGDLFFLNYMKAPDGTEIMSVRDRDRRGAIVLLTALFIAVVLLFGKMQGFRSLLSLLGSFLVIIYVLLPLLLQGWNPIVVSIAIGACILFVAIFFTHGFSWHSTVAFLGTVVSVMVTGLLAWITIDAMHLSGFFSEETMYLNLHTDGLLDFRGLLLGGIIIGVLGVLDDIAITQVAVVAELQQANRALTKKELYTKALHVGREHVSALVNTIVLAYAGVSLPLLLWFYGADASFDRIINSELFATEIARTIVGSIGLILTVPITTVLAVYAAERFAHEKSVHTHHHGHTHTHI